MNLANKISLTRIILSIPFAVLLLTPTYAAAIGAIVLVVFAGISDYYDGIIARKRKEISDMGKFLDPLADKLFVCAGLIIMSGLKDLNVPVWAVVIIISREFIINSLRTYAASRGVIMAASMAGKVKTVIQLAGLFLLLIILAAARGGIMTGINAGLFSYIIVMVIALITLYSGIVYIVKNPELFK